MNRDDFSKKILLLGNGFDLSYSLPTSYICFLQTISFILENNAINYSTVGGIFKPLSERNETIRQSYEKYKSFYDSCRLEKETLETIKEKADNNCWFLYFKNCFEENVTWIDFEREIAEVIFYFNAFFQRMQTSMMIDLSKRDERILISVLSRFRKIFIYEKKPSINDYVFSLLPEYRQNHHIMGNCPNKEKIIQTLLDDLNDFSDLLKTYLKYFVDKPMKKGGVLKIHPFLPCIDNVITFNYTNTFETISPRTEVIHIHGNVEDRIVLGIHPNKNDELEAIDTSLIQFKKYFQRVLYNTEDKYIQIIAERKEVLEQYKHDAEQNGTYFYDPDPMLLCVYGHSLDVTDKDIIEDLFEIATGIEIFYHNELAKDSYIRNIVRIFGKNKFDLLRREKQLTFTPTFKI